MTRTITARPVTADVRRDTYLTYYLTLPDGIDIGGAVTCWKTVGVRMVWAVGWTEDGRDRRVAGVNRRVIPWLPPADGILRPSPVPTAPTCLPRGRRPFADRLQPRTDIANTGNAWTWKAMTPGGGVLAVIGVRSTAVT